MNPNFLHWETCWTCAERSPRDLVGKPAEWLRARGWTSPSLVWTGGSFERVLYCPRCKDPRARFWRWPLGWVREGAREIRRFFVRIRARRRGIKTAA